MRNGRSDFVGGNVVRAGRLKPVVITGGSGFIGTNLADRLLSAGERVVLFDNLSRAGVEKNHEWLRRRHGDLVQLEVADTRNMAAVSRVVRTASAVFHFAAQVAVSEIGTASAGMMVAAAERRNRKITSTTSEIAIASVTFTSSTESRIDTERSASSSILTEAGIWAR